jgi:hypothetical protein
MVATQWNKSGDSLGTSIQAVGWVVIVIAALSAVVVILGSIQDSGDPILLPGMGIAVGIAIQGLLLAGFGRLISLAGDIKYSSQRSEAYLAQTVTNWSELSEGGKLHLLLQEHKASAQRSENHLAELGRLEFNKQKNSDQPDPQATQSAPEQTANPGPAEWYPDPSGAAQLRYWDGAAWTDQTHNR